jgi:MFS family permease
MKLNYGKVFLLGCGFLGVSLLWAVYNAYVPIFLQAGNEAFSQREGNVILYGFGLPAAITGLIMALDNVVAVFIQPVVGVASDKTRTRFGRRIPYILAATPVTVLGFMTIPFAIKQIPAGLNGQFSALIGPFLFLMAALLITLLAAAIIRTPAVALMPDIVPSQFRSQANGIINLMGGLGVVIGFLAGGLLFDIDITLPFVAGGIVVLISAAIVVIFIKEPRAYENEPASGKEPGLLDNLRFIQRDEDKSVLNLLLAIFLWFLAYNSLETFFTSYATVELNVTPGQASQLFIVAGIVFIAFAVPSGYLAGKVGRKKTISGGLVGFSLSMMVILLTTNITAIIVTLIVVGACWAMVNINSLPMVVDSVSQKQLGAYTGLYYFASMLGSIVGPVTIGASIDLFGYRSMFVFSFACLALAAFFLSRVTKGEAQPTLDSIPDMAADS